MHLAGELLKTSTGINVVHVPYKGGGPAVLALIAGEVAMLFSSLPAMLPQVIAGKIRALAVSSAMRSPAVPELPTMSEAGLRGYEATAWYGILAPAGTAREILAKLNAEIMSSLRHPDVADRLKSEGAEPGGSTPEQFAAFIKTETARWAQVIKTTGVKPQ